MMMLQCWELAPDKRPSFKTLYTNTSIFIEGLAGYLEMGFNPFSTHSHGDQGDKDAVTQRRQRRKTG